MVALAWVLGIVLFFVFSLLNYSVSSFGSVAIIGLILVGYLFSFFFWPDIVADIIQQYEPLFAAFNTAVILGFVFGRMAAAGERMEKISRKIDRWLDE